MADWDITLDGQGYMIVPGSYRSEMAVAQTVSWGETVSLDQFESGLTGEELTIESLDAWPASWPDGSRAIGPAPRRQTASGTLSTDRPVLTVRDREMLYLAAGDQLYRWDGVGPVTARWTMPAVATSLALSGGQIYASFGLAADVAAWDDISGSETPSALGTGYRANLLGGAGEMLVAVPGLAPASLDIWNQDRSASSTVWLDSSVGLITSGGDRMLIATDTALYAIDGAQYVDYRLERYGALGEPQSLGWLAIHRGELVGWVSGQVALYEVSRQRWVPLGLAGAASSGVAIVAGWLVVAVQLAGGASEELWAFDGAGWWWLDGAGGQTAAGPNGRLVSFQAASSSLYFHDLTAVADPAALVDSFSVTTYPLDTGDPAARRRWLSAGIELARNDGLPIGSWQATLESSIDGGLAWASVVAAAVTGPRMSLSGPLEIDDGKVIQLRVTLSGTSGLPPFIQSIWASWERPPRAGRRRWSFDVRAGDDVINRAGLLDPRDGQAIRSMLWAVQEAGVPVAFQDVDYGATAVERQVRLIELAEVWPKPFDQPALGAQTRLSVTLEEIS